MNQYKTHLLFPLFLLVTTIAKGEIRIETTLCICSPASPGSVTLIATGTAGPFTFRWSGPEGYESTVQSPTDITIPGTYAVAVINAYGCAVTLTTEVGECPVIDPLLLTPTPACLGASNGASTLTPITTGTAPYTYAWSTGATTAFIDVYAPGIYSVTVSDANDCTASNSLEIPADSRIEFGYSTTSPDCFGEANGAVRVDTAFGGQSPYRYALNAGVFQTQPVFGNLSAGSYRLRVEDANGCGAEALVEVVSPPTLLLDAGEDQVIRPGDTISLQAVANLLPGQSLQWRPPIGLGCDTCAVTPAFPTETTLYEVALSDANGCTVRDEVWVRVDRRGGLYIPNAFSPNGDGINDVFFVNTDASVRRIASLRIFDRWGALVFERKDSLPNDPATGWNGDIGGKPAMQGLYVYVIEVERADGVAERYSGEVMVVR